MTGEAVHAAHRVVRLAAPGRSRLQVSAGFPPASPSRARILLSPRRTGALACYGRRGRLRRETGPLPAETHPGRHRPAPRSATDVPAGPDRARVAGTPPGGRDEPPRLPGEMPRSGFPVPGKRAGRPFPAQPPARTPGARTIPGPSLRSGDCRAYIGIFCAHAERPRSGALWIRIYLAGSRFVKPGKPRIAGRAGIHRPAPRPGRRPARRGRRGRGAGADAGGHRPAGAAGARHPGRGALGSAGSAQRGGRVPVFRPYRPLRRNRAPYRTYRNPGGRHRAHSRSDRLACSGGPSFLSRHGAYADGPAPTSPHHHRGPHGHRTPRRDPRSRGRGPHRFRGPERRRRAARGTELRAHRPHGRHRADHPGRAGRHHPGPAPRRPRRGGRARDRKDGRRSAPGRLPAVRAPGAAGQARRPHRGPEPCVPALHRGGAAVAR